MSEPAVKPSLTLARSGARVGAERIALLAAIGEHGSISAAGRSLGVSYRAAWDAVQALNNLFDEPLVASQTGGASGGEARVTPRGLAVIAAFRRIEHELDALMGGFEQGLSASDVLWSLGMKTSARNALRGEIVRIEGTGVSREVVLRIAPGVEITATLTGQSAEDLGLAVGDRAIALIKASFVVLAKGEGTLRTSARNQLRGRVLSRQDGEVTSEVVLALADDKTIAATITREAAEELEIAEGDEMIALIKAPHVILAVD
jgi:molybdate transport system regulatory protein